MATAERTSEKGPAEATSPDSRRSTEPEQSAPESVSSETIASRAYELYLERGGGDGADLDDWLRAEQELGAGRNRRDRDVGDGR